MSGGTVRVFSRNKSADQRYWDGVANLPELVEEVIEDSMYDDLPFFDDLPRIRRRKSKPGKSPEE